MPKKKMKRKVKKAMKTDVINNISSEVIAAAYDAAAQSPIPVLLKVCRLCESKDGPFLNIFEADKLTAKKIDELMPFSVLEYDDLPHKICFRCSAKLEELYEFIQRCIKTQENLRMAVGKSSPFIAKSKMVKKLWEEKLNKSNMSNDDICDALIKKAMEGIQGIATKFTGTEVPSPVENKRITRSKEAQKLETQKKAEPQCEETDDVSLKQLKMGLGKDGIQSSSNKEELDVPIIKSEITQDTKSTVNLIKKSEISQSKAKEKNPSEPKIRNSINNLSFDYEEAGAVATTIKEGEGDHDKKEEAKTPFDIMDYISMIKVNGVGVLFQCKLCNRNFLRKEVVESHQCAKNGTPKVEIPKSIPPPELTKAPTVKYIKIDSNMKKSLTEKTKNAEKAENEKHVRPVSATLEEHSNETPKIKSKPKAGPASKTGRTGGTSDSSVPKQSPKQPPNTDSPNPPDLPSVHFPAMPNLNSRYKLVPGPDNRFTLVEDTSGLPPQPFQNDVPTTETKKGGRKRKSNEIVNNTELKSKEIIRQQKLDSPEVIDLEDTTKPYPVGLFQTMSHSGRLYEPSVSEAPAPFTTPAMKKQSYTIVQTGNPSKLLISKATPVEEEAPKKRQRKAKLVAKDDGQMEQPFRVTLEDVAPPKESRIFTFINVDPLLQPSYVLPTDNIIQESQISTSSAIQSQHTQNKDSKDKYSCNMCGETFSREKKLLAHIQSHYMKMDEEDQRRVDKTSKRKGKK